MSTRANVIVKYGNEDIIFYRHCDGYPEELGKTLKNLCNWNYSSVQALLNIIKYGSLELTDSIHGDIEYLYIIDLFNREGMYNTTQEEIQKILNLYEKYQTSSDESLKKYISVIDYIERNLKGEDNLSTYTEEENEQS